MCCKTILFQLTIISLTKIATCIFYVQIIIINFKTTRVKSWVKISKVMPQPQVHSPGKGREALRQKVLNLSFKIRYGLTVHNFKKVLNLSFKIRYGLTVHIIRF